MISVQQFPLADILWEHTLNNFGNLRLYFGVQFQVVNSPVSRANRNRTWIIQRTDSNHLNNGSLPIFGNGKFRLGKLERGVIITNAQSGLTLARDRPTPSDVGELEQDGFIFLNPRVVRDRHVETFLKFARQEDQSAGGRFEIVSLKCGTFGGCIVHLQSTVGRTGALNGYDRVGSIHIFADIKVHIRKLKLTVVVP